MVVHYKKYHLILTFILIAACFLNLAVGSVSIPLESIFEILTGRFSGKSSWEYIVLQYRLPKLVIASLVGMSLSIAGMMMQTLFQNPMAEPYVLGVSSGASLGVAICILGGSLLPFSMQDWLTGQTAIVLSALIGSFVVMMIVLTISQRIRQAATLLIVGLMFSSFTGAFVSVLAYISTAEELRKFTFWNLGSLGSVTWNQLAFVAPLLFLGLLVSFGINKPLNSLLLGEAYARTLGIRIKRTKFLIILSSCILVAVCTAFVGPIAFVGLAIPHITRIIYKTTNHFVLFVGNLLNGALILVLCDVISQLPGEQMVLPINAVTSILGAPLVIYLMLKQYK